MKKKYTERELKKIAFQLGNPAGNFGIEVANKMSVVNLNLIHKTIDNLILKPNQEILEIGHGKTNHLEYIFSKTGKLKYYGLDISELMNEEAKNVNSELIKNKKATFKLYDGNNIPFQDSKFDRIFTVNTIYFWSNPEEFMNELYRVANFLYASENLSDLHLKRNNDIKKLIDLTEIYKLDLFSEINKLIELDNR